MSTPPFNPFDFMNTPWGKLPMGNNGIPGTDINELEKRITELKTVEQWLNMNLSLLRTTIQGLEVQRGTLAAIAAFSKSYAPADKKEAQKPESLGNASPGSAGEPPPAGLEQAAWWWNSMQEQFGQMLSAAQASAQSMVTPDTNTAATREQNQGAKTTSGSGNGDAKGSQAKGSS